MVSAAQYAERFVRTADGLSLFVRDYPARGAAIRLPVVCLHGLTRNSADFENVAPAIAALGRRVIVPDMRGRARSDYDSDPSRYRVETYVADVQRIMDDLAVPRAVFVGTSMGGIITMVLAAGAGNRVAAAVINDIGPVIDPAGIARIMSYVGRIGPLRSWDEAVAVIRKVQSVAYPGANEEFWQAFARRNMRAAAGGEIVFDYDPAVRTAMLQPPPSPPPDMKRVFAALGPKPVLLLRGALSDLLSRDGIAVMRDIKPDLQVVEVPDVGHAPTLDDTVSRRAVLDFLDSAGVP